MPRTDLERMDGFGHAKPKNTNTNWIKIKNLQMKRRSDTQARERKRTGRGTEGRSNGRDVKWITISF